MDPAFIKTLLLGVKATVQAQIPATAPLVPPAAAMKPQAATAATNKTPAQTGKSKTNPPPAKTPAAQDPVMDLTGGTNGVGGAASNGGPDLDDDDMGLDDPSMSPGEARDAALAMIRQIYAQGHVAEVKALQKDFAIAKFYDVPVTEGHNLWRRVTSLAQSVGMRP